MQMEIQAVTQPTTREARRETNAPALTRTNDLIDQVERRAEIPYVAPHEMIETKEYILVTHFTSAGATRFFGPFRPKVPISKDSLVRGTYCANVVFTEEGGKQSTLMLPAGGCFCLIMGRVEYALYEYTSAFAERIRQLRETEVHYLSMIDQKSQY